MLKFSVTRCFRKRSVSDEVNSITKAVMWDITLTEVNTGQRVINSINKIIILTNP